MKQELKGQGAEFAQRNGDQRCGELLEYERENATLHCKSAWSPYPDASPEGLGNARRSASAENESGQTGATVQSQNVASERTVSWWQKFYEDHADQAQRITNLPRETSDGPAVGSGLRAMADRLP